MIDFCKRTAGSALFHDLIVVVIILNAVILSIETSQHVMQSVGGGIYTINWLIQSIFVFEIDGLEAAIRSKAYTS